MRNVAFCSKLATAAAHAEAASTQREETAIGETGTGGGTAAGKGG